MQMFEIAIGETKVIVREPQMLDIENAMQVAGNRQGVNQYLFGLLFAKELLKNTIKKVNGREIKKVELEAIDKILKPSEITSCGQKLQEIMNMEASEEVKLTILNSGDN